MHLHFTVVQASNTDIHRIHTHARIPLHPAISCDSVVIVSQLEMQSAMYLLYQPIMLAECKAGGN